MQTQVGAWLRAAKQESKLNILTSLTHENYEQNLCETGHNFYSIKHPTLKDWNKYREIPKNYHIYDLATGPWHEEFDLVLAQSVFGQFQFLQPIADRLGSPLIRLEHTNAEHLDPRQVLESSKCRGAMNVFISEDQIKKWRMEDANCRVIKHCVNDYFSPSRDASDNGHILSVVNDFIGRGQILGFNLWKQLVHGLPFRVRGDSAGLSTACKDISELRDEYRSARIFLNTSISSPIPSVMLEAAACGLAIVSTNTCAIPEYFTHGYDCLLSNDPKELRKYLEMLLQNDNMVKELGSNAIKTMKEKCSLSRFVDEWNDVFEETRLK